MKRFWYVMFLLVAVPVHAQELVTNGTFDTTVTGWGALGSSSSHNASAGCPSGSGPGSLQIDGDGGIGFNGPAQCVDISSLGLSADENFEAAVCLNPTNYSPAANDGRFEWFYFTTSDCTGTFTSYNSFFRSAPPMNTWTRFSVGTGQVGGNLPPGTNSIQLRVFFSNVPSSAVILYDDVSLNASLPVGLSNFTIE